jgi:hypothetical protein
MEPSTAIIHSSSISLPFLQTRRALKLAISLYAPVDAVSVFKFTDEDEKVITFYVGPLEVSVLTPTASVVFPSAVKVHAWNTVQVGICDGQVTVGVNGTEEKWQVDEFGEMLQAWRIDVGGGKAIFKDFWVDKEFEGVVGESEKYLDNEFLFFKSNYEIHRFNPDEHKLMQSTVPFQARAGEQQKRKVSKELNFKRYIWDQEKYLNFL